MHRFLIALGSLGILTGLIVYIAFAPSTTSINSDIHQQTLLNVLILGDQGSNQIRQWRVAQAMEETADRIGGGNMVLLAGDNFYSQGIESTSDSQWLYAFENVYRGENLRRLPFYPVLGNHDVLGDVDALIQYSESHLGSNRWRMKARHYYEDFGYTPECGGAPLLRVVFLDTTNTALSLAEEAEFVRLSLKQSTARWRVVVGHHPIRNYGTHEESDEMFDTILPLLNMMQVDLYISGHEHNQQLIHRPGEPLFLISGAGGKATYPVDDVGDYLLAKSEENGFSLLNIRNDLLSVELYGLKDIPLSHYEIAPHTPVCTS